jgi:hypothetical protein
VVKIVGKRSDKRNERGRKNSGSWRGKEGETEGRQLLFEVGQTRPSRLLITE